VIRLTDQGGTAFYLAPDAIAQIIPAPPPAQRIGIESIVTTFRGKEWGVQQKAEEIFAACQSNTPKEEPCS
jgi:hypothetical protein